MWRGPEWLIYIRDLVCLGLGGVLLWHEAMSVEPALERLMVFIALMTTPGAFAAVAVSRSSIGGSSSVSPSASSPSASSSPPPGGEQ